MNKKLTAIVSVLFIAVVIASLGCLGGGGSAKDMAKMTPEGTSHLIHYDLQTIRDDKDLDDVYESIEKNWPEKLDEYGLDIDDTNYEAAAGSITILGGKFDLENVRDELDDAEFDKDDYKGVELWTGEDEAVAISGDKVLYGDKDNVKECIKVMKGDQQSVYDDNDDFREVIDKLPGGIMMTVSYYYGYNEYDGELVRGSVWVKEDDDTLKMKGVIKFKDENDAEDAKSDLKRDLKEELDDVAVELKGKFLEYTGKKDIDEWERIW
jgi:hypothetical protein